MRHRGSRWRKPNIAFPHRYVLIKDPPALDPHFSPRIRRHSHPFSSRLYFEGWILMLRYPRVISSRCTSIRVAFSSSYALSLCALFAALYLNFRACVGRTSDDSTSMLIVPLLLVPFFLDYIFAGSFRNQRSFRECFRAILSRISHWVAFQSHHNKWKKKGKDSFISWQSQLLIGYSNILYYILLNKIFT